MKIKDISSQLPNTRSPVMSRALLGAATIAMISALPQLAVAQTPETNTSSPVTNTLENEIVVTGFRQSIADALAAKRNSGNITDAIKAEDIGKSTDQNIAEALQRVTGVSINRGESGEGTTVVVRGAPAALNNITLNGVPLTNGGSSSEVNLSQFSSDVLSSIEVVKTPSASHDEGSLGASIILKSFSPLEVKKDRRAIEIQGRYNSFADEDQNFSIGDDLLKDDHKFSLSLSEKLMDDRLGLSLVVIDESATTRRDQYDLGQGYRSVNASRFGGGAINADTGQFITQFDYGDGNGLQDIIALMPQQLRFSNNQVNTDRQTIAGTIQYQPTDDLNIKLDVTYAKLDTDRRTNEFSAISNAGNRDTANAALQDHLVFDPNTFTLVRNIHTAGPGPNNNNREDVLQYADLRHSTEQDTLSFSGLIEKTVGDFDFSLRGGHSKTDLVTPQRLFTRFRNVRNRGSGVTLGFDCGTTPEMCSFVIPDDYINDPNTFAYNTGSVQDQFGSDEATSLYFDTGWNKEWGAFTSFEAGLKWSKREKDFNDSAQGFNVAATGNALTANGFTFDDFAIAGVVPSNFGESLGINANPPGDNFFALNGELVISELAALGFEPNLRLNLRNTREVSLDVIGGYVQGNFELIDGSISGDMGLRLVQTKSESRGFSGYDFFNGPLTTDENEAFFGSDAATIAAIGGQLLGDSANTPTVGNHKYTNLLPSLNLNWTVREDMILRFAASQTIARPRIDSIRSGFALTENIFGANSRATFGSPTLNPFKSRNLDLSYEWYFDPNSLFSVAIFDKNLQNFEETNSFFAFWRDVRDEFFDANGNALTDDQINFVATADGALLPFSGGDNQPGCMPNREQDLSTPFGAEACDLVLITQNRNGTGGYVRGVELGLQHNFEYLPSILGGMGVVANYTYSDSKADEESDDTGTVLFPATPLPETSEHTLNLTGFYEDERVLLRLAYNTRSDFLIDRSTRNGHALWTEGFDTLDASGSLKINDMFSINFQAQNLTDSVTRQYVTTGTEATGVIPAESYDFGGNTARTFRLRNTGRIYRVGIRMTF